MLQRGLGFKVQRRCLPPTSPPCVCGCRRDGHGRCRARPGLRGCCTRCRITNSQGKPLTMHAEALYSCGHLRLRITRRGRIVQRRWARRFKDLLAGCSRAVMCLVSVLLPPLCSSWMGTCRATCSSSHCPSTLQLSPRRLTRRCHPAVRRAVPPPRCRSRARGVRALAPRPSRQPRGGCGAVRNCPGVDRASPRWSEPWRAGRGRRGGREGD